MNKRTYGAEELSELLGISKSKAYQHIKQMNDELKAKGYLIVRGRVPIEYAEQRFFISTSQRQEG